MKWLRQSCVRISSFLAGAVLMAFSLVPASAANASSRPFDDIKGSFAEQAIIQMHAKGYLNGKSNRQFSPKADMTRGEWVAVLDRIFGLQPVYSSVAAYRDVNTNDWYYGSVETAVNVGLIQGTNSSTFMPKSPITRQEAAVMLSRLMTSTPAAAGCTRYTDDGDIAAWAATAVCQAGQKGLMIGSDGQFNPRKPLTREEAAVLLQRITQAVKVNETAAEPIQLGWQYDQTTEQYESSVIHSNINTLSPRWYFLEDEGSQISSNVDTSLLSWAEQHGKQVWPMFGNRSDADSTHLMLTDSARKNQIIQLLTDEVQKYSLDGIVLDLENVYPSDRSALTAYVKELAAALHQAGAVLSICVSPDQGSDWTAAFDYASLGKTADYIILMGYDEHWAGRIDPGSVASLPWVEQGLDNLLNEVSADHIILALPLYTRDWSVDENNRTAAETDISLIQQNLLTHLMNKQVSWSDTLGQYTGSYYDNQSVLHKIWLEEGRSLSLKMQLGLNEHIRGFAYWYTGGASDDVWTSLINAESYHNRVF
ncbi:S-layer homology domain-containing protein [Paenibacillus jiagnxiensis]|uniref:S-layer homology domain-containing protein n=1 Tax=Paenibacillus jiagnxiensis TaxID=3228926 RepID=UPI0033A24262